MASAADRSNAVVLLLLIYCLMYFPLFFGSSVLVCEEEKKAGCFAIIVIQMYCYYKWYVALPHGAVGWFAVFDCGIS